MWLGMPTSATLKQHILMSLALWFWFGLVLIIVIMLTTVYYSCLQGTSDSRCWWIGNLKAFWDCFRIIVPSGDFALQWCGPSLSRLTHIFFEKRIGASLEISNVKKTQTSCSWWSFFFPFIWYGTILSYAGIFYPLVENSIHQISISQWSS